MSNTKCKPPICEYSIAREKCIKPNPYIQFISKCSRENIPFSSCVNSYNLNKKKASEKACDYYKEYLLHNKEKSKEKLKKAPKKEPKEKPKKEPKEKPKKEPKEKPKKEIKEKPKKEIKEKPKKEPKTEIKTRGRPRKKISPIPSPIKSSIKFPSSLSFEIPSNKSIRKTSSSIKPIKEIKRSSSKTFNISDSFISANDYSHLKKSQKTTSSIITPSNPSSLSKSFKTGKTEQTSSSSKSFKTVPSSSNSFKTVPSLNSTSFKSLKTIKTKTPSDIVYDIKEIQNENKELEEKLRALINKKSLTSSEKKRINAEKIGKFILPIIDRISTINNRIKYYKILHKYISSRNKYPNNCLRLYKYDENDNPIYRIGNRIILDKKIGSNSKYGAVFLSYYRLTNKKFGKIFKFATKISDASRHRNIAEYTILKDLTDITIANKCPHFPISFGKFICNSQNINDVKSNIYLSDKNHSFVRQSSESFKSLLNDLPENIYGKNKIIITINELAEGDSYHFIKKHYLNDKILFNSLIQILLSIMFFYKYINAFHHDTHSGNFLYHKIKPGGYFHYNIYGKDYYLENIGFLWVIWDFGLINPFPNSLLINNNKYGQTYENTLIIYDYFRIIKDGFINEKNHGDMNDAYQFSDYFTFIITKLYDKLHDSSYISNTDIKALPSLNKELLKILTINIYFNTFKTSLNADDKIINANSPYYI
jgi:hypothetical protein